LKTKIPFNVVLQTGVMQVMCTIQGQTYVFLVGLVSIGRSQTLLVDRVAAVSQHTHLLPRLQLPVKV